MNPGSAKPLRLSCAKRRPPAMAARSHVSLPLDVLSIGGPSPARPFYSFLALVCSRLSFAHDQPYPALPLSRSLA